MQKMLRIAFKEKTLEVYILILNGAEDQEDLTQEKLAKGIRKGKK